MRRVHGECRDAWCAAWGTAEERREWIQRAAADVAVTARLEKVLDRARERGFDVDYTSAVLARARSLVGTLDSGAIALPPSIRGTLDQLRTEFTTIEFPDDSTHQPVAAIAAPVFDHRRRVSLLLAVHPLVDLSSRKIGAVGQHVARRATAISA